MCGHKRARSRTTGSSTSGAACRREGNPRSAQRSIQQRNGRKTLTTIQGIDEKFDQVKLVKVFKKVRT